MADQRPLVVVEGQIQQIALTDKLPVEVLATGTPTGTKFVRDDGTLAEPSVTPSDMARIFAFAAAHG